MKNRIIACIALIFLLISLLVSCNLPGGENPGGENPGGENPGGENPTCNHADADDDGSCDICQESVYVIIDFYTLNDLHGKFDDSDSDEGVDELTSYLQATVKNDDNYVFLATGDMWQGSSASNLTRGFIITEWMNKLDFSAMTIGNHEFDWGEDDIIANKEIASFPLLAINVYDRDTNKLAEYATPSLIVERGGVKIGIIGAIGDCYSSISPDKVEDVYFKVGRELTELVKAESQRLREAGADFIVYSLHDGYGSSSGGSITDSQLSPYYDISLSDGYVDLVFEAHTHKSYVLKDSHGVYHAQGGGDNQGLIHLEVKINSVSGTSSVYPPKFISSSTYLSYSDSPIVDELLEKYEEQISPGNAALGNNPSYKNSTYIADLVARLYTEWGVEQYGDKYDIVLGGGYLKLRSPYKLDTGTVCYSDLQAILPFDNELALCSIRGYYLKKKFIETDNRDYHIYFSEHGQAIRNSIDDNAIYYVIVDMYTATYAPNRLTIIEKYEEELYARDLLAQYIKSGKMNN